MTKIESMKQMLGDMFKASKPKKPKTFLKSPKTLIKPTNVLQKG